MVKQHLWKLIVAVILAATLVAPGVSATPMVFQSPPSPACSSSLCVTINPNGTFDAQTGTATINGTVTCTDNFSSLSGYVNLRQKLGRLHIIQGSASSYFSSSCPGTVAWSAKVTPNYGAFGGGNATATASVSGYVQVCYWDPWWGWYCNNYYSSASTGDTAVKLKGR